MKIVHFEASNVKRIKAIEITPDDTMQVIAGRNGQGKSSVLDAIYLALAGRKAGRETVEPIRQGERHARVSLDLGEIKVTRTWEGDAPSKLLVTSAEGAVFKSPQTMLDKLIGSLSFDPVAFTRQKPSEQREALLGLVQLDVDLDALEAERSELYAERTEVGRKRDALGAPEIDAELETAEVPASELLTAVRDAEQQNRRRLQLSHQREQAQLNIAHLRQRLELAEQELAELQDQPIPDEVNVAEIEGKLSSLEEHNARVRANNDQRAKLEEQQSRQAEYDALTGQIKELDQHKADALAGAEFPVEGLGFGEGGVTYNRVPFSQASSAEQLRVSLAMAIASNPDLRVLRIADGSLLDDTSIALIRQQLVDSDYQCWIERVGDDAGETTVVIEDGEIKA